jgi:hypothetical protein
MRTVGIFDVQEGIWTMNNKRGIPKESLGMARSKSWVPLMLKSTRDFGDP